MHPGEFVLTLIRDLEAVGIEAVYLRNYEYLPEVVGNDVDLLLRRGTSVPALARIASMAPRHGWRVLRSVQFSPISIFLASADFREFLHIDLFDRLEWHSIEYADPELFFRGRQWNGQVHHPSPGDEVFLNVCTRLIYHGVIRDKHRMQVHGIIERGLGDEIVRAFRQHLGPTLGSRLGETVIQENWAQAEVLRKTLRRGIIIRRGLMCPRSAATGLWRYLVRSMDRLLAPPGPFIVFEGADGVGKSTVIEGVAPLMKELTGQANTILFHWKPTKTSIRHAGALAGSACDPRGAPQRSMPASMLFLAYHWIGFWFGYLRYILPARARNRAVLGDRYAYEFFLDPARLRLRVPGWLSQLAAASVPQPDLVICLIADPRQVHNRKPELNEVEIEEYQVKLTAMVKGGGRFSLLNADGNIDAVVQDARELLLHSLFPRK